MHAQSTINTSAYTSKQLIALSIFLFSSISLFAQMSGQIFNTPGTQTWTAPQGVWEITVECFGAGGRGATVTTANGGGGGGGAYAKKNLITVTPGETYTLHVGAGSNSSAPGEDTWFIDASTVMATGGNSVADNSNVGATGGQDTASVGDVRHSGGNGATSGNNASGGGGSSAGHAANGNHASGSNGATAPSGGGNGGNGTTGNGVGHAGSQPGGGGGGANRNGGEGNHAGGQGGHGRLIISWAEEQQAPLPVELSNFFAKPASNGVVLNWTTLSEINSEYFSIEHSADGRNFQPVGIVDAYGFSNMRRDYSYTHNINNGGYHYYRLKIVDFDGSYEHSPVVVVQREGSVNNDVRAYFQPGSILIEEAPATADGQIYLYDIQGRQIVVFQHREAATMQEFQIPALQSGMYILHFVQMDGTPHAIKLWRP